MTLCPAIRRVCPDCREDYCERPLICAYCNLAVCDSCFKETHASPTHKAIR